jgi:hypothetical protein
VRGGYTLARPAADINLADVMRAVDGPLVSVHDESIATMHYPGPAVGLRDVWMALRASLRSVLEVVSLAEEYQSAEADRGRGLNGSQGTRPPHSSTSAAIRCDVSAGGSDSRFTSSSMARSSAVNRSVCWRACSSHDATTKSSTN